MKKFLIKKPLVFIFLFLLLLLSIIFPGQILNYPGYIDYETIFSLFGLMLITEGMRRSGFFTNFSLRLLKKVKTERKLALFLVVLSLILSPFLTNDITLFIVVPLTLSLKKFFKNEIYRFIIFEAMGVNVGSMLTPMGNPQNIYIWRRYDVPFLAFMLNLFPIFIILSLILILFIYIFFKDRPLIIHGERIFKNDVDLKLLYLSLLLMAVFITSIELNFIYYIFPLIFVICLIFYRDVIKTIDWILIILFVLMFIDFGCLSNIKPLREFMFGINLSKDTNLYFTSIFISQFISNVPCAIFVSKFSINWPILSIGVNVGGNGLVIASLANIIALRLSKDRKSWIRFHLFSLPYLVLTSLIVYFLVLKSI